MTRYLRVGKNPRRVLPPITVLPPTSGSGAPTYLGYTHQRTVISPTATMVQTLPTVSPSDLLIWWVTTAPATHTTPTGWTLLDVGSEPDIRTSIYYRVADGTEGSTESISFSGSVDQVGTMVSIRPNGLDFSTKPPEGSIAVASGDPPTVTPSTGAATYRVFVCSHWERGYPSAMPTGYTQINTAEYTLGVGVTEVQQCLGYQDVAITTSEDPAAFTMVNTGGINQNASTVAVYFDAGDPSVAAFAHTHPTSDVTDVATATVKGQLLVSDGDSWETLAVGSNDQVLTADSAQSLGVKWAAAGGGDHGTLTGLTDDDHTQYLNTTRHDADDHSALGFAGELLMQDGVTAPPVPLENEAQDDWLFGE